MHFLTLDNILNQIFDFLFFSFKGTVIPDEDLIPEVIEILEKRSPGGFQPWTGKRSDEEAEYRPWLGKRSGNENPDKESKTYMWGRLKKAAQQYQWNRMRKNSNQYQWSRL